MANNFITGLDIGSQSLKAAVAEVKSDGRTVLVNLFKTPSGGMRKGSVDDLAEMTRSLNIMFGEIKKVSKNALKNLFKHIENRSLFKFYFGFFGIYQFAFSLHNF